MAGSCCSLIRGGKSIFFAISWKVPKSPTQ